MPRPIRNVIEQPDQQPSPELLRLHARARFLQRRSQQLRTLSQQLKADSAALQRDSAVILSQFRKSSVVSLLREMEADDLE